MSSSRTVLGWQIQCEPACDTPPLVLDWDVALTFNASTSATARSILAGKAQTAPSHVGHLRACVPHSGTICHTALPSELKKALPIF